MSTQSLTMPVQIKISVDPQGAVIAQGGDDLAHALLARAGFGRALDATPGTFSLPLSPDAEQLRMAVARAGRMLRVAGYAVLVPAELKTIPVHSARRTRAQCSTLELGIDELSNDLTDCADLADIARLADLIFNEGEGVLVSVEDFATQAAHRLAAFDTEEAGAVADQFLSIARRLDTITAIYGFIGEDLLDLHDAEIGA